MLEAQRNAADIRRRLFYRRTPRLEPKFVAPVSVPAPEEQAALDRTEREAALIEVWTTTARPESIAIPLTGINLRFIIHVAKIYFQLTEVELVSHRRTNALVRPRQIIMYLAKKNTMLSLPQIGARLGRFDHTTVLHGVKKITALIAAGDMAVIHDVAHMENILGIT